ncbi:MAG: non-heme iron oxygenase ferredoxin subunit [Actinobacteria bacterium]|jgi:nitrite reductase/ring-hydroxylating ferredoxin subunit|nr:non-heme iron oxygenase ferredoxin subunit [Actinomycetota bacterium]MCO5301449.1 non-heme iron oxygenase ferredoxin subunit [Candidatus Nanopelagicales bacterium]MCB9428542.1 non-heme iron oxygenase ferredoxin subunit [Actinomycetota bacterium]HPE13808.1 non-heme iron oxygenase ferredoxin subunit [Actinomycetota bacterium]HPJ19336.1 non-heme iron oxygenase ferredoxin subunit [Actinomycetota bacterium]
MADVSVRLADLRDRQPRRVVIDGVQVALVRVGDEVFAVNDVCSHAEVSLSEGEVSDCTIECWLHGSRFDLRTGDPSGPPAFEPIATYPVQIEGQGDDAVVLVAVPEEAR